MLAKLKTDFQRVELQFNDFDFNNKMVEALMSGQVLNSRVFIIIYLVYKYRIIQTERWFIALHKPVQ